MEESNVSVIGGLVNRVSRGTISLLIEELS